MSPSSPSRSPLVMALVSRSPLLADDLFLNERQSIDWHFRAELAF